MRVFYNSFLGLFASDTKLYREYSVYFQVFAIFVHRRRSWVIFQSVYEYISIY
jgi:hypothetical protein